MRKDDGIGKIQLVVVGLLVLYLVVTLLFPGFIPRLLGRDTTDYRSIARKQYGYDDGDQPAEFYRGFCAAVEYVQDDLMKFVEGTDTYQTIYDAGYDQGYYEGHEKGREDAINTVEDWYEP